jgi:hypothetical protein
MNAMSRFVPATLLSLAVAGCSDTLAVENIIDPDIERVFATPAAIEQTIASGYQSCHNAIVQNGELQPQLLTLGLESYSQLNNFFMGPRGGIPRSPVVNIRGTDGGHFGTFSRLSRGGRLSVNALDALEKLLSDPTKTLGTPAQNIRARAFGFFVAGCHQGWLAMTYDSAAIVNPRMRVDSIPPLSGAKTVMAGAIAMFDSAIAIASLPAATGTSGFPLPGTWLNGDTALSTQGGFIRLVRSQRARFRAGVARTPSERAAVDWIAVIADAENGITTDYAPSSGGSTGWNIGFAGNQMHVEPAWSQMSMMYYGMADVSGGYDTWLATPVDQRTPFLVVSPDRRWPQGATRAAQRTASVQPTGLSSRPYVSNRSVQDAPGDPWGWSFYDFYRTKYIRNNSQTGPYPDFLKAENDLLAAEGYIRTGNIAAAAAKIDLSRVARGQLPALSGVITTTTQPVPGGTSCVPRVPQGANGPTACGNIMEALKWEKRMETAYTGFGAWYFDGRGWGDLIENTPLEYPVPFAELDARQKPYYGLGGGGASSAAKGTYGF